MPGRCCVPLCNNENGGHKFPVDDNVKKLWVLSIKRVDLADKTKLWQPGAGDVVCRDHFTAEDYREFGAYAPGSRKRLKKSAVPSIFAFKKQPSSTRGDRLVKRNNGKVEQVCIPDIGASVEIQPTVDQFVDVGIQCTIGSQDTKIECKEYPGLRIENYKDDEDAVKYYTGLESYDHFQMFFAVLGPAAFELAYQSKALSPENELFLTLIKLRQATDDYKLCLDFKINERTVSYIFKTWLAFLFYELKDLEFWPSRELIDKHFPKSFKAMFPTTRIILDATEVPIQKKTNCDAQRITWSSYKNQNTMKTMIGITPRGCVSYVSDAYGGSVSDRQIMERSDLVSEPGKFQPGDSVLADRGIMVQDLFAIKDVRVNVPTTMKGKNQLDPATVIRDRRIAGKRIHVERVIGYAKTYKILHRKLSSSKLHLGSMIVYVVFMMCNYRASIVGENA